MLINYDNCNLSSLIKSYLNSEQTAYYIPEKLVIEKMEQQKIRKTKKNILENIQHTLNILEDFFSVWDGIKNEHWREIKYYSYSIDNRNTITIKIKIESY